MPYRCNPGHPMWLSVLLFLLGVLVGTGSALAGTYEITDVKVDVTAGTVNQARDKALLQAQRIAFARLLERIALFEDRENLPLLSDNEVAALVQHFGVVNEKTSSVRYIGWMDFTFKSKAVRRLLRDYGLPFAETMSKPVLVLPVYQGLGPLVLWDEINPWRDAWNARPPVDSLVPTVMALGDLGDISAITAEQAAAGDIGVLLELAGRYEAAEILVPSAVMRVDPWQVQPLLEVQVSRYGAAGQEMGYARSFKPLKGEDADSLMRRAAMELTRSIEGAWKRDNLISFGSSGVTRVRVSISGLGDWIGIKRTLAEVAVVEKTEVVMLSRHQVEVDLHHVGDVDQLAVALRQADLYLWPDADVWVLSSAPPMVQSEPEMVFEPEPFPTTTVPEKPWP